MGFSFRKSIKLGKGTRLNLSKSGIGLSTGTKGFRVSKGPRGSRVTAGIPGSGIYYTKSFGTGKKRRSNSSSKESSTSLPFMIIVLLFLALIFFQEKILFIIIPVIIIGVYYFKSNTPISSENNEIIASDYEEDLEFKDSKLSENTFYGKNEFYLKNLKKINEYEKELVNASKIMYELSKENIELAIVQGNEFFKIVNKFKNFCKTYGDEGIKYFNQMWNTSSNSDKSFITIREEFFNNMVNNKTELQEKINLKKKKEILLKNIDEKILKEIKNNDGILQKDLFLLFDPDIKSNISKILINLEKSEKIIRVKRGNSYQLFIK